MLLCVHGISSWLLILLPFRRWPHSVPAHLWFDRQLLLGLQVLCCQNRWSLRRGTVTAAHKAERSSCRCLDALNDVYTLTLLTPPPTASPTTSPTTSPTALPTPSDELSASEDEHLKINFLLVVFSFFSHVCVFRDQRDKDFLETKKNSTRVWTLLALLSFLCSFHSSPLSLPPFSLFFPAFFPFLRTCSSLVGIN